jgi:hypothetical protein
MATSAEMQLLYRVANAPINPFPFPHIYVREVFPAEFYRRLREHLPPKETLTTLVKLRRVSANYPETRLVLPLEPEHVHRLDEPLRSFWSEVASWLLGREFAAMVLNKFRPYLEERFGDARAQHFTDEALLVQDYTTYRLPPHTDSPRKVLSFLFYLPADDALSHLGTSLYLPKNRRNVSDGSRYHDPAEFDRLLTMPYTANTLFAFLKTPNAFHGVEPITEDIRRDLLLYDIQLADAGPSPAKTDPANVRFSF